jgi:hypothetical protein
MVHQTTLMELMAKVGGRDNPGEIFPTQSWGDRHGQVAASTSHKGALGLAPCRVGVSGELQIIPLGKPLTSIDLRVLYKTVLFTSLIFLEQKIEKGWSIIYFNGVPSALEYYMGYLSHNKIRSMVKKDWGTPLPKPLWAIFGVLIFCMGF